MREILADLEQAFALSDPDPVRRAQLQMPPKRFYKDVAVAAEDGGFVVRLDGKLARTPARAPLKLPTRAAAELVAGEFAAQAETIDPVGMPVLRIANSAIDGVAADPEAVLEDIVRFCGSDLVCYRADSPAELVSRQTVAWDAVLDWIGSALGVRFQVAQGIVHVAQPAQAVEAVRVRLKQETEPMRLAALHVMTTLTGSALIALAVAGGGLSVEEAWAAAHVDEGWQAEQWGEDAEAEARRAARKRDMLAAARLLQAVR